MTLFLLIKIALITLSVYSQQVRYYVNTVTNSGGGFGIDVDRITGNLYICDSPSSTTSINKIHSGSVGGTAAVFGNSSCCYGLAFEPTSGDVYAGTGTAIAKYTKGGSALVIAGSDSGFSDGRGTNAKFASVRSVSISPRTGNLFVPDPGNGLRKVEPSSRLVSTFGNRFGGDGFGLLSATQNLLEYIAQVSFNVQTGDMFIINYMSGTIWRLTETGSLSHMAGAGSGGYFDGVGTNVLFNLPQGLCVDSENNWVYVSDTNNHVIRKLDISTRRVTTVAGKASTAGGTDAYATAAMFFTPASMTIDQYGVVFISEYMIGRVRRLSPSAGAATFDTNLQKWSCLPGYQTTGTSTCAQCPLGFYKSVTGALSCSQCLTGYEPSADRTTCVPCVTGKYRSSSSNNVCIDCPNNASCDATSFICNAGYKLNSTSNGCDTCPLNQESNAARTACNMCKITTEYFSVVTKNCISCPSGATCNGITFTCNAGYEPNADGQGCQLCSEGYSKSASGNFSCTLCSSGLESAVNRQSCNSCAVTKYRPSSFAKCIPCPPYGVCSATLLTKCQNGYKPNAINDGCEQCPTGQESIDGMNCVPCRDGYFKPNQTYASCIKCPEGHLNCTGSIVNCPSGSVFDTNVQCKRIGPLPTVTIYPKGGNGKTANMEFESNSTTALVPIIVGVLCFLFGMVLNAFLMCWCCKASIGARKTKLIDDRYSLTASTTSLNTDSQKTYTQTTTIRGSTRPYSGSTPNSENQTTSWQDRTTISPSYYMNNA